MESLEEASELNVGKKQVSKETGVALRKDPEGRAGNGQRVTAQFPQKSSVGGQEDWRE